MLNVGVITIPDFNNYGNRLQNYALQEALIKTGCKPISYVPYRPNYTKKLIRTFLGIGYDGSFAEKKRKIKRLKSFLNFDKEYVITYPVGSTTYTSDLCEDCDFFISGSDQVWNPNWYTGYTFLDFAQDKEKFSYAASFGTDSIPKNLADIYRTYLSDFNMITVREKSGKAIISDILNTDVEIVPDPTFALSSEEWREIEKCPHLKNIEGSYVLLYFLGGIDQERQMQIDSLCKKASINRYINVLDYTNSNASESGPLEFLYLIDNADLILTDSFHACVFSIIFHKKFIAFERLGKGKNMNNRIETLLEKFDLMSSRYGDTCSLSDVDYLRIDDVCESERMLVFSTLKTMINRVECNEVR